MNENEASLKVEFEIVSNDSGDSPNLSESASSANARKSGHPEVPGASSTASEETKKILDAVRASFDPVLAAAREARRGAADYKHPSGGSGGGRQPPNPPPGGDDSNNPSNRRPRHPDDPPERLWPHVTNETLRRRYWRERRMRMARSQREARRLDQITQKIPKSFQPKVRDIHQRRANWDAYQKNQRRQQADKKREQKRLARSNVNFQKKLERKRTIIRRQAMRRKKLTIARYRGQGRSAGAFLGAVTGSRIGGPLGAGFGAQIGSMAGGRAGTAFASLGPAGIAIGAAVTAVAAGAATVYKTYSTAHRAFNSVVADGLSPFTRGLARSVPVIGNFATTLEAVTKRAQRDLAMYKPFSLKLTGLEKINDVLLQFGRFRNLKDTGFDGRSLEHYLSNFSRMQNRYNIASEQLEAMLSRVLYGRLLPILERLVILVEKAADNSDAIEAFLSTFLDNLTPTLVNALSTAAIAILGPVQGGLIAETCKQLLKWLDMDFGVKQEEQAKEKRKIAEALIQNMQSNLQLLLHGLKGVGRPKGVDATPEERSALGKLLQNFGGGIPRGLPGMAGGGA